jgi:hypothetical protein
MTILDDHTTQSFGGEWRNEPLPVPVPAYTVQGVDDPMQALAAVVTVRFALTRDMLAAAADQGLFHSDMHPDDWSVEYTRAVVEQGLALHGVSYYRGEEYAKLTGSCERHIARNVRAVYRAIDRAYPEVLSTVSLDGPTGRPTASCSRCDWSDTDTVEDVMGRALDHSEHEHGGPAAGVAA